MFSKVNITDIFLDHISTLKDNRTGKLSRSDVFVFFLLPLFVSITLVYFGFLIEKQFATILLAGFSAFAALLLNLLLLIFDIADKVKKSEKDVNIFFNLLEEIYINISFCISMSVLLIIIISGFFLGIENSIFLCLISFFGYFISLVFILSLLMVLKRIYRLLSTKMSSMIANSQI